MHDTVKIERDRSSAMRVRVQRPAESTAATGGAQEPAKLLDLPTVVSPCCRTQDEVSAGIMTSRDQTSADTAASSPEASDASVPEAWAASCISCGSKSGSPASSPLWAPACA